MVVLLNMMDSAAVSEGDCPDGWGCKDTGAIIPP